jgi:hypothetical protein
VAVNITDLAYLFAWAGALRAMDLNINTDWGQLLDLFAIQTERDQRRERTAI